MSHNDWFSKKSGGTSTRLMDWSGSVPDSDFNERTWHTALLLAERFPQPRSRIGLWGENNLDYLAALFGVLRAGHVAVPLNTRLTPRELEAVATTAELAGLLVTREFPLGHRSALHGLSIYSLSERETHADEAAARNLRELGEKETAVLICSSGTAGYIKVVPHTLHGLLHHAEAVCKHLDVTWRDSWILCLPLFHIGGLAIPFRCMVSHASLIMWQTSDAHHINHLIDSEKATLISLVPTALERLLHLRHGQPLPKELRAVIVGGGHVPQQLLEKCPQALATYGMTEAGSMVTCARPGCNAEERATAGVPLPGSEVKIVDEHSKETPRGQSGEILVRGPGMANQYLGDRKATEKVFVKGWIHTGDMGRLDQNGRLHVQARRQDLVITGGENVSPQEIEDVLRQHPRVAAAAVVPLDDPEWGQVPGALVVLTAGPALERTDLLHFLEGKLARYKFPKRIIFTDALPLLGNGKPDLAEVRRRLENR
jgi:o-succinylbenzoate---CoA ligase